MYIKNKQLQEQEQILYWNDKSRFTPFEQVPQVYEEHQELRIISIDYSKLDLNEYFGSNRLFLGWSSLEYLIFMQYPIFSYSPVLLYEDIQSNHL